MTDDEVRNASGIDLEVVAFSQDPSGTTQYRITIKTKHPDYTGNEEVYETYVERRFNEFRDLYARLPKTGAVPPMPKKKIVHKASTFEARRSAFDKMLKSIAASQELAFSPPVLEFLGLKKRTKTPVRTPDNQTAATSSTSVNRKSTQSPSSTPVRPTQPVNSQMRLLEDDNEKPWARYYSKDKLEADAVTTKRPAPRPSSTANGLLSGDDKVVKSATVEFTETEVAADAKVRTVSKPVETAPALLEEDAEDPLQKLINVVHPPQTATAADQPVVPRKKTATDTSTVDALDTSTMDSGDIQKYIAASGDVATNPSTKSMFDD